MPIRTYYPDGITTMFDSDAVTNGVCLGVYRVQAGLSFYKQWPLLAGATVRVVGRFGGDPTNPGANQDYGSGVEITYPGGVPTLTALPWQWDRDLIVWATGVPALQSGGSMQALSASGVIALSPNARGLNYIGLATYTSKHDSTWVHDVDANGNDLYDAELGWWDIEVQASAGAQVVAIAELSDSDCLVEPPRLFWNGTKWVGSVQCTSGPTEPYAPWPEIRAPRVHCFAKPESPGLGAQCAIYDLDSTLAYDLLAGPLLDTNGRVTIPKLSVDPIPAPASGRFGVFGSVAWRRWSGARFSVTQVDEMGALIRTGNMLRAAWTCVALSSAGATWANNWRYTRTFPSDFEIINLNRFAP